MRYGVVMMTEEDVQRLLAGLADGSLRLVLEEESALNTISATATTGSQASSSRAQGLARGERTVVVYCGGETEWSEQLGATAEQATRLRTAGATDR